jgi:predicted metalloprotease with PDZ domain
VAELAQVRTAFAELFKAQDMLPGAPWTYLVMSRSRPIGSFTTTPRFESVLLQVGPSEAWNGALRLSMAQQLARRWVGDAIRLTPAAGHERELGWFNDGVARYLATLLLGRLGFLHPAEWREAIAGELSVLATSPYASKGNAELSALASKDPVARATLTARGALYAAHESAVILARSKGERRLENVLADLLHQARGDKDASTSPLPASAWLDALAKDDPDAAKTFDAMIVKGGKIELPKDALGPCFRAGTGEYAAFDPGFDVEATKIDKDDKVTGVRDGGPAAKAGLKDGDVLESMVAREDDATVPVKLVVTRGGQKVNITYVPRGAHGRGQTWTRVKGIADDKCGDPP